MENNFSFNVQEENIFNQPVPSKSHYLLHALSRRKRLSQDDDKRLRNMETGLKGEMAFHKLLQKELTVPHIPLHNLQLELNMNELQFDCLLIFHNLIHLVEVKNFYGDYIAKEDHWIHAKTKDPVRNPLHQLSRAKLSLKVWLKMNQIPLPVISRIIFMNPNFYLYEASASMQIVFPSQHGSYFKQLRKNIQPINNQHEQLVAKLKSSHIVQSRHEYIPKYSYSELQKGVYCNNCSIALAKPKHNYFQCRGCGNRERIDDALLQSIIEFQLLFPDIPLTVNRIKKWIAGVLSESTVRRCLIQNFSKRGKGRGTYYVNNF